MSGSGSFSIVLPMPPSINLLYQRRRGGGTALTKYAKKFRAKVNSLVSKRLAELARFNMGSNAVYRMDMVVYFDRLENAGWHSGKSKTRFKRIDVDNRVKFLQDSLIKAIGAEDDTQIFSGEQTKKEGIPARAEVTLTVEDPSKFLRSCSEGPWPYDLEGEEFEWQMI